MCKVNALYDENQESVDRHVHDYSKVVRVDKLKLTPFSCNTDSALLICGVAWIWTR